MSNDTKVITFSFRKDNFSKIFSNYDFNNLIRKYIEAKTLIPVGEHRNPFKIFENLKPNLRRPLDEPAQTQKYLDLIGVNEYILGLMLEFKKDKFISIIRRLSSSSFKDLNFAADLDELDFERIKISSPDRNFVLKDTIDFSDSAFKILLLIAITETLKDFTKGLLTKETHFLTVRQKTGSDEPLVIVQRGNLNPLYIDQLVDLNMHLFEGLNEFLFIGTVEKPKY